MRHWHCLVHCEYHLAFAAKQLQYITAAPKEVVDDIYTQTLLLTGTHWQLQLPQQITAKSVTTGDGIRGMIGWLQ